MAEDYSAPAWELSKENAAPLARGRNVKKLEKSLSRKSSGGGDEQAKQTMKHFETLVAQETDDPLIHWLSYIKYHQDAFPSDTNAQFLLMERCARTLMNNPRYANDDRFVRVCIMYADKTSFPADVFKYLHQQKIGTKVAVFWIAWAFLAEKKEDYSFAEKVFQKGISKEAQPLAHLKTRHKQFQRRMSRHWLNESQKAEDDEEEEDVQGGRAALGGLTETRVKRNDRRQRSSRRQDRGSSSRSTGQRTFSDRNSSQPRPSSSNNGVEAAGGFQIFVDENADGHDGHDVLEHNGEVHERELETEQARKKENTRDAERWNERGGYSSRFAPPAAASRTARPPAPSFAVHVDPECEAQHEKDRDKTRGQFQKGGRALQKRDREDMSEKLVKDPMRYITNPEKLKKETKPSGVACGFDKALLSLDESGQECCFEEHRAMRKCYKLVDSSLNINLLKENTIMEVEDSIEEVEMEEDTTVASKSSSQGARRVLFSLNVSVDHDMKSVVLNASTASSTFDGHVGMAASREEETINTKFAMKELSMMFSSPAHGLGGGDNDSLKKRPKLNDSYSVVVMDDDGEYSVNNSIIAHEAPEKLKFEILSEEVDKKSGGFEIFKEEPAPPKGFQIFSEEPPSPVQPVTKKAGFEIFSEEPAVAEPPTKKAGFAIFSDTQEDEQPKSGADRAPFSIRQDSDSESADEADDAGNGDTATLSLFGDAMDALQDLSHSKVNDTTASPQKKAFQIFTDENTSFKGDQSDCDETAVDDEAGDTATLSLFGDAMDALNDMKEMRPSRPSPPAFAAQDTSIDDFRKYRPRDSGAILVDTTAFGDISLIEANNQLSPTEAFGNVEKVDYVSLHKDDIKSSLREISRQATHMDDRVAFSGPETDLALTLSKEGNVVDMPTYKMPRGLKRKALSQGEEIKVGSRTGVIKHELGKGSYGVVVLMDSVVESRTLAVKAQCPTDCLAWEFVLMKRLVERTKSHVTNSVFPFPKPMSFASLSDGGLLGMTAGSKNGMNLVDISNIYKVREGGPVPELIAMHYTARMLKHIELLHWHGKMLHCDAKPDNWVMAASESAFDGCTERIEASELMLVDFGRAVDLTTAGRDGMDPLSVKLSGNATTKDMACAAMRMDLGWSFDIDTFGICASSHVLLYGSHIELDMGRSSKRWTLRKPLRRYWEKDLWNELFDTLLNLDDITQTAIGSRPTSLRQLRGKFENHLRGHAKELESLLKHQARILPKKRLS